MPVEGAAALSLLRKGNINLMTEAVKLHGIWTPREVWQALEESVKLQSHYAELLNMQDGGQRLQFADAHAWLERLRILRQEKSC